MKKYLWILCALLFATLAVACSDDDDAPSNVSVVTLSDTQITLVRGERYTLTARVETLDGKGCDVTWVTSDGRVVTVDAEGNLTAGETGSARVYALAENRQAVCDVTVTLPGEAHVGDYYYSDGTYSADLNPKKECIGVVFQVGQHANDCSDYSQTGIGEAACHGYVVALQDASEELCLWGVYGYEIGLYPVDDGGNKIDNFTNNGGDTDWSGYLYTEKITLEAERNGGFTPDTQEGYPVGYYTRQFAQAVPAPANSSGWFIPAVSQLCTVYGLREQLNAREGMTRLRNRWYWSSSECYALADGSINCLDVSTGMVGYRGKYDAIGLIRPILAF